MKLTYEVSRASAKLTIDAIAMLLPKNPLTKKVKEKADEILEKIKTPGVRITIEEV